MQEKIRFQKRFPADLDKILSPHDRNSPDTANRIRDSINRALGLVETFPEMYAVVYDDIRLVKTKDYPFLIEYRIVDGIPVIVSILHSSREESTD